MARRSEDVLGGNTVEAELMYSIDSGETPVSLVKEPGEGPDTRTGAAYDHHIATIHDGRPLVGKLDIDAEGVVLIDHKTAVKDFYDDDEVVSVYYPEVEEIVMAATGASKVVVFDHTIRVDDEEKQIARKVRPPVKNMHNDFNDKSAAQRVRDLLPADEAEARLKKRYGSINVWRSINGTVQTAPLVVCDARSIDDDKDWIAAERHYGERVGVVLNLRYSPDHTWFYFPDMNENEVVLLKNHDSKTDGTAKFTAHGSFQHPDTKPDAAPRESIEIRTLMFWD